MPSQTLKLRRPDVGAGCRKARPAGEMGWRAVLGPRRLRVGTATSSRRPPPTWRAARRLTAELPARARAEADHTRDACSERTPQSWRDLAAGGYHETASASTFDGQLQQIRHVDDHEVHKRSWDVFIPGARGACTALADARIGPNRRLARQEERMEAEASFVETWFSTST